MPELERMGRVVDRMAWPERILWLALTFGGGSVITFGDYIIEVSAPAKALILAFFVLIVCASFYYRLGWIERSGGDLGADTDTPDMNVWEPFYLIEPRYLQVTDQERRAVNQKILDGLALGQMQSWGRRVPNSDWIDDAIPGTSGPTPEPISREYWNRADFTYMFFSGEQRDQLVHSQPNKQGELPRYRDVRFNSNQVEQCLGVTRVRLDSVLVSDVSRFAKDVIERLEAPEPQQSIYELVSSAGPLAGRLQGLGDLEAVSEPLLRHLDYIKRCKDELTKAAKSKAENAQNLEANLNHLKVLSAASAKSLLSDLERMKKY